jgi:parallel beta-helix repeat protein
MKSAKIIIVPDDYPIIQQAINDAMDSDTILMQAENRSGNTVVNKMVDIIAVDEFRGTFIDGDGVDDSPFLIPGGDNRGRYILMSQYLHLFSWKQTVKEAGLEDGEYGRYLRSSGDVIVVPDDYPTIQEAVDNAVDGDTIFVRAGVYYENVVVDKQLKICGEGSSVTFIDGGGEEKHVFHVISDRVEVSGFTFRKSGIDFSGILLEADLCIVYDNVFHDCGDGITLLHAQGDLVRNNTMFGNRLGIKLSESNGNNITSNNISNNEVGIDLWKSNGNNITTDNISNNTFGLFLQYSSGNNITGNNISNNRYGIDVWDSSGSTITGNDISNNKDGIYFWGSSNNVITNNFFLGGGLYLMYSYRNVVKNNTINYKPLIYLEEESGIIVDSNAGQVILVNCDNIVIQNQNISKTDCGIQLWETNDCFIKSNNISNNDRGIELWYSNGNTLTSNDISNNYWGGIDLSYSSSNTMTGNNISNNSGGGIWLSDFCNNNTLIGNNISNSEEGIYLWGSSGNTIATNSVSNNYYGIELFYSLGNKIFYNNFIENRVNAYFVNSFLTRWNKNYWEDWLGIGPKIIPGKIWLDVISIPWLNFDWHPAKEPYPI